MENVFDSNGQTRPKRIRIDSMNGEERRQSYKRLFCEIIDVMCQNDSVRFSENAKLLFLNHLDSRHSKPSFLDEVIDLFAKKNRRIELNYKQ
jgi:hypothetical protein